MLLLGKTAHYPSYQTIINLPKSIDLKKKLNRLKIGNLVSKKTDLRE